MKKSFFIMIILFACFFILVACTNGATDPDPEPEPKETNQANETEENTSSNDENSEVVPSNDEDGSSEEENVNDEENSPKIVLENEVFKIYQPAPDTEVNGDFVVSGLARVFEGTINYEFEDGHFIIDQGFTTASEGAPEWGEFEFTIKLDDERNYAGRVVLSEESAEDGSRMNELLIPINVVE